MPINPLIRCSRFAEVFEFYTKVVEFEYVEGADPTTAGEAAYCVLSREGAQISDLDGAGDFVTTQTSPRNYPESCS